jgi:hypothetical protein
VLDQLARTPLSAHPRDGVAFVLGQGVLEAAHDLARAPQSEG